ncbi:hypothetical protein BEL07_03085 [Mycolicibacterium grossiae]|uniref:Uncharacterized protein n=1 Tax=Mycolicibacterium grossiae TaxID=1552759 RepID=A0A1E8QAY0_9MYCO|nr:hypothetical protein BEL07_03085 [Mycolicibacterium grossiae]
MQAKTAAAKRWNSPDVDNLSREYAARRITDCVKKVLASAPPLTDEQRDRIAAILRGGDAA